MSLSLDNDVHELKLGSTFGQPSSSNLKTGFHTIRYDFKPASVDTSKEACVEVGSRNQVTISVPHVEASGTSHTVFKGNQQPLTKECVLIIDHETGTFTLEKLSSKIAVKKTRLDGSSKAMQHFNASRSTGRVTPIDKKSSNSKAKLEPKNSPESEALSITPLHSDTSIKGSEDLNLIGEISDSSEEEDNAPSASKPESPLQKTISSSHPSNHVHKFDVLNNDLALSESDSDSD